jgi:hypothetical protein
MEYHEPDLIQRCLCGLRKYLRRSIDGMTVMTAAVAQPDTRLPAQNTKIHKCLMAVVQAWPHTIITQDIARTALLNGGAVGRASRARWGLNLETDKHRGSLAAVVKE